MALVRFQFFRYTDSDVQWRLISANNRALGRSTDTFAGYEDCVLAVKHLQADLSGLRRAIRQESRGQWRWELRADGTAVAESTRGYVRHGDCDSVLRQFVEAVPNATLSTSVQVFPSLDHYRRLTVPPPRRADRLVPRLA